MYIEGNNVKKYSKLTYFELGSVKCKEFKTMWVSIIFTCTIYKKWIWKWTLYLENTGIFPKGEKNYKISLYNSLTYHKLLVMWVLTMEKQST